jgi:hypothetical protein
MSLSTPSPMVMAAVRPEMPAPMMTICARIGGVLEEKARVLHVVCDETAEPTRPSYALPATLKSEERRHGKTPFQTRPPLDQRLESQAKRPRNDRVCPLRGVDGSGLARVFFTPAVLVGAAMCSAC